jgi:hypothetical protein
MLDFDWQLLEFYVSAYSWILEFSIVAISIIAILRVFEVVIQMEFKVTVL